MENGVSKQKRGGVALPQILASDGGFANACPEGEAHGACLACLLHGPTVGNGTRLKGGTGHVSETEALASDHVACCLEGLLLGHGVCLN